MSHPLPFQLDPSGRSAAYAHQMDDRAADGDHEAGAIRQAARIPAKSHTQATGLHSGTGRDVGDGTSAARTRGGEDAGDGRQREAMAGAVGDQGLLSESNARAAVYGERAPLIAATSKDSGKGGRGDQLRKRKLEPTPSAFSVGSPRLSDSQEIFIGSTSTQRALGGSLDSVQIERVGDGHDEYYDDSVAGSRDASTPSYMCCARKTDRHGFDLVFVKRLWQLLKIIFKSFRDKPALWLSVLLGLCLAEQIIIYMVGLVPSRYYSILQRKDKAEFATQTINCFILVLAISAIRAFEVFVARNLYLQYRQRLTIYLQNLYFGPSCYEANTVDGRVDNIDQRIAQDVEKFSDVLSNVLAKTIIIPLTIIYYTNECQKAMGYIGPVSVYCFFVIGTVVNRIIMTFIVPYVFQQEKLEGDFRYSHAHIRANAESVAFYHGQLKEKQNVTRRFTKLIGVQYKLVARSLPLNFSINMFDYAGSIISYLVIAVPIFAGDYDSDLSNIAALISQSAFVSIYLISCFSTIIDLSNDFGNLAGYTHRIGELVEVLCDINSKKSASQDAPLSPMQRPESKIVFENVSFETPHNHVKIISDLTLAIEQHMNVRIVGSSGCGKSSLIRILNDLWPVSSGAIRKPSAIGKGGLFYIPQIPYVSDGSLKDLLKYPNAHETSSLTQEDISFLGGVFCPEAVRTAVVDEDDIIFSVLEAVKLSHLIVRAGGLDTWHDWMFYDCLSPGEKQRLAFAGLFLHRPTFAILDESTSALSVDLEAELYTLCRCLEITTISIAHRPTLAKFHDYVLFLDGSSGWKWQKSNPANDAL